VKRVALLAALALVAVGSASAGSGRTLRGNGMTLPLPSGWYGLAAGAAGFQAADFPLPRRARSSADLVRVPRGDVHVIVWNYGPWDEYRPHVRATPTPLVLRRRNLGGPFEGFPTRDAFALRTARVGGDMLEVLADLGPKPFTSSALGKVNAVLATLHVLPPHVLLPRNGRLASDGVAVRLLPGWSGRLEVPAERYGARLVLRAARGDVHVELLEITASDPAPHLDLPIAFTSRQTFRRGTLLYAHRAFSTGGRSFDLSVAVPSAGDLGVANRFLTTLEVEARPWTFRSCDLSLQLPGTWRVAIRPRSGCYPVLKLRGRHVLVVLSELRAGENPAGRILTRGGRRFSVVVTPASARGAADAVLSTLRARPRR
jgi:hypothetical protein